ncbi:Methyltransferase domain-containing protein [Saccharopolyspora antimicrobica]|uniref:Methyltransferase domain-containing protein n=1 Tax=Saccharopolyspora antimicrobica TaxID=455193 RepID=A0A1I4WW61_9PSEU|nr:class I SAM-dependent methyltransferase [Saccharopolyspora antimicrobica]RKT82955.1 methyltransferase family protein [Saccharopolyspora antimicrobica]SFN17209.1 Methyltransferase domain-containing protein [Saccharopolyspora antimicrobica]
MAHRGLAMSEEEVFADFLGRVDLSGAVVAEIGGAFPTELIEQRGVARWYSVDPNREAARSGVREVIAVPAEEMPLPDSSADAVFSCNAFQFLDIGRTLLQAARVLKPGGLLYSHFGPIWSAVDGHQLEYVSYQGRDLAFWRDTLLPPWAHLAYDREELRELLRSGMPEDLADLLVWHVHDSTTINRSFFEDYLDAAVRSGLQWCEVSASEHLDYEIATPELDSALLREVAPNQLAADLTRERGRPTSVGIRDVLMVLRKPAA